MIDKLKSFFAKYSATTHLLILFWNAFLVAWGTKSNVVFYGITINASDTVSWIQRVLHFPSWAIGLVTLGLNAAMVYSNLKTKDAKVFEAKKTLKMVSKRAVYEN